ncbi:MAG: sigma-70 family RNA polymerase sigma factor [Ilumatobacteraceae bacterium]|nr:sigma-70 family RNA polymerase sigma factor [Ilumatobacteraceae bacterium]
MRDTEAVAVRQGPAATLEVLYRAEYTGMVRLAFTLIGNNAEAEEVVQDSFLEISRRFDDLGQPGAYLRTVVVSRCRSVLRRRRLMRQNPPTRPSDLPPEVESLWDVLEQLPEHQRIAVVLRYYCGYRAAEIAKITDQPAATVRSHLRRAMKSMRKELTP